MVKEIKIYCLYNPNTCEIRYIGRTIRPLNTRLVQHISKAKNNYSNSHKENWIRSLLKNGIRPKIKLLTILNCTWNESHIYEKSLIQKHLVSHNLVNGDDRGPGNTGAKNININTEIERVNKITQHFNKEENKTNFYNKIYCYNGDGTFYKTFKSRKFIVEELGYTPNTITNHITREKRGNNVQIIGKHFFSQNKYINFFSKK